MKRLFMIASLCIFSTQASAQTATEAVQFFYTDPGEELNIANIDRFTGAAKTELEAAIKTSNSEDGSCINFMLSVDGQDFDAAELKKTLVLTEAKAGDQATVVAKFTSFEEEHEVFWTLEQADGVWKISDIASKASEWKLSELDCSSE